MIGNTILETYLNRVSSEWCRDTQKNLGVKLKYQSDLDVLQFIEKDLMSVSFVVPRLNLGDV